MNGRTNSSGTTINDLEIPLDPCTNLVAVAGNGQVSLTWMDPKDKYATPEGEAMEDTDQLVSEWSHTIVVRKVGSQPQGPNDGTIITSSSVRNQYQTTPYIDTGLVNYNEYYYALYAINKDGTASDSRISDLLIPKAMVLASELPVGTIININENNIPIEYIVVNQGLPDEPYRIYDSSCTGTWLLRKDIYALSEYRDGINNYAAASKLHDKLDELFTLYDADIQNIIKDVIIPYYQTSTGELMDLYDGKDCKLFILSTTEMGFSYLDYNGVPNEGGKLSYFISGSDVTAEAKRIALYNGIPYEYWTRTPYKHNTSLVYSIREDGVAVYGNGYDCGVRPAFIIDSSSMIEYNTTL